MEEREISTLRKRGKSLKSAPVSVGWRPMYSGRAAFLTQARIRSEAWAERHGDLQMSVPEAGQGVENSFRLRWRRCEQVHPGELEDSNTTLTSMKSNFQAQKRPLQERPETPLKKTIIFRHYWSEGCEVTHGAFDLPGVRCR